MKITNVCLKPLKDKGKLKAVGSIEFDDAFVVRGVAVVEGKKGLFVAMPHQKEDEEKYRDIAFSTDKELREEIAKAFLSAYEEKQEKEEADGLFGI